MFSRTPVSQALRASLRRPATKSHLSLLPLTQTAIIPQASQRPATAPRPFSSSATSLTRITPQPDPSNPEPSKKLHAGTAHVAEPANITEAQYHELADSYIDGIVEKLEKLQEEKEEVEVEYSVRLFAH